MNRTIHKKLTSKDNLLHVTNTHLIAEGNEVAINRWEQKLIMALQSEYLKPREKAVESILELAKTI